MCPLCKKSIIDPASVEAIFDAQVAAANWLIPADIAAQDILI